MPMTFRIGMIQQIKRGMNAEAPPPPSIAYLLPIINSFPTVPQCYSMIVQ